jgi:hypothetical protein
VGTRFDATTVLGDGFFDCFFVFSESGGLGAQLMTMMVMMMDILFFSVGVEDSNGLLI